MNLKKWGTVLAVSVATLSLAACGNNPKETVIESTKTVYEAKQMDYSTKFSMEANVKGTDIESMIDNETLAELKNFSLSLSGKTDYEAKKDEGTIGLNAKSELLTLKFSLPYYMDLNKNKMYADLDNLSAFEQFVEQYAPLFAEMKGKTVQLDLTDEMWGLDTEALDIAKTQKETAKILGEALEALPEESFKKEDKTYTVTIKGDDLKEIIEDLFVTEAKASGEFTDEDIAEFKKTLKEIDLSKSTLKTSYTLDGKDIKKQKTVLDLIVKSDGETLAIKFKVDTTFNSINKPLTFDFDPSKKDILTVEELETIMSEFEAEMYGVMDEEVYGVDPEIVVN